MHGLRGRAHFGLCKAKRPRMRSNGEGQHDRELVHHGRAAEEFQNDVCLFFLVGRKLEKILFQAITY